MPTVRSYSQQQQTAPLPDVRRNRLPVGQVETPLVRAAPSADTFGAQVGEVATRLGEGLYGQELDARAKEILQVKERQNRTAVFEADNQLSAWENQYLYDPQKGALNKRGKDAFGLPDSVSQDFEKVYGDLWQNLSNDDQRAAFEQLAHTRRKDVQATVMRHTAQQMQAFETENFQSYVENSRSAALANYQDPLRINTEAERTRTAVYNYGHDNGLGPEWIQSTSEKAVSAIHAGVIDRYLAAGQDQFAKNYFANFKDEMSGEDQLKVQRPLEEGSLRGESQRVADAIARDYGAKPDATLTGLLDQAATQSDPKVRDQVESRLRQWWVAKKQDENDLQQQRSAAAKDAIDRTMQGLLKAVDQGAPRDMLGVHRLVDQVSPGLWTQLDDKQRNVLESYAKKLVEKGKIETDIGTYYELLQKASSSATRDKFATTSLLDFAHKLSDSDFKHLAELQADIRKGDEKKADETLGDYRSIDEIVKRSVGNSGLDPNPKPNTAEWRQLAEFEDAVAKRLQSIPKGKDKGKKEIQEIVDDLLKPATVGTGGGIPLTLFGLFPGARIGGGGTEKYTFEITLDDIPEAERAQVIQALRNQGKPVTDESVLKLYRDTHLKKQ